MNREEVIQSTINITTELKKLIEDGSITYNEASEFDDLLASILSKNGVPYKQGSLSNYQIENGEEDSYDVSY